MVRTSLVIAALLSIAAFFWVGHSQLRSQPAGAAGRRPLYYVDPMHPSYKSDKPGVAPDCGMALVPVHPDAAPSGPSSMPPDAPGAVRIDAAAGRMAGIRVAPVEKRDVSLVVRAVGRVAAEDTRIYRINAGVDGIIRETAQDSVGVLVKKGQKLATFYAPDFLAASSGFLAAVERVPGSGGSDGARTMPFPGALSKQGTGSIQGYTDRLRNLGMSDAQIQHMAETRQLQETIDIVSPVDGVVVNRNISGGQHFEHNMEFYRIADLSRVWVLAEVDEREAAHLRPGEDARITLRNRGSRLAARITDSLPQSEPGGGTVKLRLEVENPGLSLRPEMLVDVEFPVRMPPAITTPVDAVVDSGERSRVYVESADGLYEPREVETGWRQGDRVEIRSGLRAGERVVVGATFLVDSESRLEAASASNPDAGQPHAQTKMAGVKDPSCGMPVDAAKAAASGRAVVTGGTTYYFCSAKCKQDFQKLHASSPHHGDDDD